MMDCHGAGGSDGAGEYYLAGQMGHGDRYSGKLGAWHGPVEMLKKLGLLPNQDVQDQDFRCVVRGMDPAKGKVAFHHTGGAFNPTGLLKAIWNDASSTQRLKIFETLRTDGVVMGRLSATSSAEKITYAWEKAAGHLKGKALELLEKSVFKCARKVPGYTLTAPAGPARDAGWDMTGTLPKDFGVLWGRARPEQREIIETVMREAANQVVDYINTYCGVTRCGKDGVDQIKCDMIAAVFLDYAARPCDQRGNELGQEREHLKTQDALLVAGRSIFIDPHPHAHIFFPNSVLCEDGKWRGLDSQRLYQAQAAAGGVWHAAMTRGLQQKLGITFDNSAENGLVTIPAIQRNVIAEMSKRTQLIDLTKDKYGLKDVPGREIGRKLFDTIRLECRDKHITLSNEAFNDHIQSRMDMVGYTQEESDKVFADGAKVLGAGGFALKPPTEEDVMAAANALLEGDSVFTDHKLRAKVLGKFTGSCPPADILKVVDHVIDTQLVHMGEWERRKQLYSSQEMIALEANYSDIAEHATHENAVTEKIFDEAVLEVGKNKAAAGKPLAADQIGASRHSLIGNKMVSAVIGPAGSGKTALLEIVQCALKKAGYHILGIATSWVASNQLVAEGKLDQAAAFAKLLYDFKQGTLVLTSKHAIVVDEGSLNSSKEIGELLVAANAAGSKVIIFGDPEQIGSAGAGAPLRLIVQRSGAYELEKVWRHTQEWDRQANLDIRAGGEKLRKGVEAHIEHGRLHIEGTNEEAVAAMFASWKEYRSANPEKSQQMISRSNKDCNRLNSFARESLRSDKKLTGEDHVITVKINNDIKDLAFSDGDFIQFRLKSKSTEIRDGDEVIEGQVFNRTRATINKIHSDAGKVSRIDVELWSGDQKTGKTMSLTTADFRSGKFAMEHAYAVTPDSSQGMTVDRCLVLPAGMNLERFYVSATRHRSGMEMFISRSEMHAQSARYMDFDAFVDRSDFTNEMATESLISGLRKSGKMTTQDLISDKCQRADQSCLAGTRFESMVKTDQALIKTWQLLDAGKKASAASAEIADALRQSTVSVTQKIRENGLTGKFLRPSIIHAPDNSQQIVVKNHRDQEALKTSLLDAAKAWGTRIYITGRKSFHAACVAVSKELCIKFGSPETAAFLKGHVNEQRDRHERSGRAARAVAERFGCGIDLSGSAAVAADGVRVVRDRELRLHQMTVSDVVLSQSGQGVAQTDGLLLDDASEHVRGRQSGRDGRSEQVRQADPGVGGLEGGQGKGVGGVEKVQAPAPAVSEPGVKKTPEPRARQRLSMKPRGQ